MQKSVAKRYYVILLPPYIFPELNLPPNYI